MKLIKITKNVCNGFHLSESIFGLITAGLWLHFEHVIKVVDLVALLKAARDHNPTGGRGTERAWRTPDCRKMPHPLGMSLLPLLSRSHLLIVIKGMLHTVIGIFFQALSDHPEIVYISWLWQWSLQINSDVKCIQPSKSFKCVCIWNWQKATCVHLLPVRCRPTRCKDRDVVWFIHYFVSSSRQS